MVAVNAIITSCQSYISHISGTDVDTVVAGIGSWDQATPESVVWINKNIPDRQDVAERVSAKVIVCGPDIGYTPELARQKKILLHSPSPRLLIMKIASVFFPPVIEPRISPSAIIHEEAVIGEGCFIGEHCVIGKCKIGNNTVIQHHSTVCDGVTIGNNCNINIGAIIGIASAGIERDMDYKLISFPHYAGVRIGDQVCIGAQTIIVTGVLTDTLVGNGTTIDSHCLIGHNTVIGEDVYISSSACISGSVTIDNGCTLFSGVKIKEWVRIGEFSCVGMGSLVTKDIPSYELWYGSPAKHVRKLSEKFKPFE